MKRQIQGCRVKIAGLMFCLVFASAGCVQVASDEIGVRVNNLYGGVEEKAKITGTYLYIPGIHSFYWFPKTQQKLEMIEESREPIETEQGSDAATEMKDAAQRPWGGYELELQQVEAQAKMLEQVRVAPHRRVEGKQNIRLKTADGNDVWVDVTVSYQVMEDRAPVLVQKIGPRMDSVVDIVGPEVRGFVRQVLGELKTGEFYQALEREAKIKKALDALNLRLNPFGINVVSLNVPEFRFSREYENILREKALAEQKRQEYERLQDAAEQEKLAKKNKARGEADAMIALAEGRMLRAQQEAEAAYNARASRAEAVGEKLNNEAEGLAAITSALSVPGGEMQVRRELARAIQGKKIMVLPGGAGGTINIMDLNELLQSYGSIKAIESAGSAGQEKEKE
jgi:regulator of protease activity HflC (stomatin/prohibitin superfamily)